MQLPCSAPPPRCPAPDCCWPFPRWCKAASSVAQEIYGSLGPAFFGLRTTVWILLLMALWRIKRPEALKEHSPTALGHVFGDDRVPEVKTLRRKLTRLASYHGAAEFGRALAKHRVGRRGEALGFLYIDGHVRVYHGKHRLPEAHVARMRLSMPATIGCWVNDASGDRLFVVTAEVNAGLVKMLPDIPARLATVGSGAAGTTYPPSAEEETTARESLRLPASGWSGGQAGCPWWREWNAGHRWHMIRQVTQPP